MPSRIPEIARCHARTGAAMTVSGVSGMCPRVCRLEDRRGRDSVATMTHLWTVVCGAPLVVMPANGDGSGGGGLAPGQWRDDDLLPGLEPDVRRGLSAVPL